ncbi:gp037 [Erwinia phage vB_EamP-S6]|uniref:Gp037 n=1 Tax=Erwinia phage vB_EamP-S6 TaxID=1051675 RepID=G0YQC9_9CAUD|nr:gp037 [Erwinia phage vB_EamP-S6]AEJ81556.1 gp037 [Erwinia phage vB_EamP-S6]
MPSVKHAVIVIQLDDGNIVQRPMVAVETEIVTAMLAEHDTGILKTIPLKGMSFKKSGELVHEGIHQQ